MGEREPTLEEEEGEREVREDPVPVLQGRGVRELVPELEGVVEALRVGVAPSDWERVVVGMEDGVGALEREDEPEVVEVELRHSVGAGERVRPWVKLGVKVPKEAEEVADGEGERVVRVAEMTGEREAVEVKVWEYVEQGVGEVEGVTC